jgi:hypothetical protein
MRKQGMTRNSGLARMLDFYNKAAKRADRARYIARVVHERITQAGLTGEPITAKPPSSFQ